ncbi:MAG TPA: methyltransferase [Beijerinckiaceae bacterium]|nr:methyltransferase [Beijerinckiaceae bacterium]
MSAAGPVRRETFIRAETKVLPVPHAPEIRLHLADEAIPLWEKTEEQLAAIGLAPPFWAFAWAGGQALARYCLDHPDLVRRRRVLDFAAGSGLVGIAAAKAGAGAVEAVEIDPFAVTAINLNARENDVTLSVRHADLIGQEGGWDVIFAGDVFYERDMAERVFRWLDALHRRGAVVLIGDPGRSYLPKDRLEALATYQIPVTRALEDAEVKRTSVWRIRG